MLTGQAGHDCGDAADRRPGEDDRVLAVVIVTYNSADVLPGLLDSLPTGLEDVSRWQVLVMDNASSDESVRLASAHPVGARIISMGRNAGYAAAINAGSAAAGPDADLLILNPDIRLLPGCGGVLRRHLSDPAVGIVVPQLLDEEGVVARSVRREPSLLTAWTDALLGTKIAARLGAGEIVHDVELYKSGGKVEWATGAILAIPAATRRRVGSWDESFFLYSEEVDYLRRVRAMGLEVIYVPSAQAMHIGGAYHDNLFLASLMTTNRIRYYRRHHGPLATSLFRLSIVVGETMRATLGPGHRAALRAALSAG